jgi:hypothetical protein
MTRSTQEAETLASVLKIAVKVDSHARNGEVRYRLTFPQALHELGLGGPKNEGPLELPALGDVLSGGRQICAVQSSRLLTFCLPVGVFPDSVYEFLADYISSELGNRHVGLQMEHVCPHCGHDGSKTFWSYKLQPDD